MIISLSAYCKPPGVGGADSRDSVRRVEKTKARIERQRTRIMNQWDERTLKQRRTDRRVVTVLAIGAVVLVHSLAYKE